MTQGWREGAWDWKVVDEDGSRVEMADRDYLSRHAADMAARQAKLVLEGYEPPQRVDYQQFYRPDTSQGHNSP